MKASQAIISFLATFVAAAPQNLGERAVIARQSEESLEARQLWKEFLDARQLGGSVGTTENEFTQGGCRDIIFIFARGSTEAGNMGTICGPPTAQGLKDKYGDARVAIEGVDYAAALNTNLLPGGADPAGIAEMKDLLTTAASQCPDSVLVAGGYSQGAAVSHGAIKDLPENVKNQIAGVVTFGDTQNQQDGGQIPNFPADKTKIICNTGDLVCVGTLTIAAAHLDYARRAPEAISFLTSKIDAAL